MRRFVAFILLATALLGFSFSGKAAQPSFPPLSGRVVDQASIFEADTKAQLENRLAAFEQSTQNQLVVVTVQSLEGQAIEDYGYQLGRHWGIGQKGKNNGLLLIVAPNERQVRIEVGYGLEGEVTDAASRLIIERVIVPQFKKGDYAAGTAEGVSAIMALIKDGQLPLPATESAPESGKIPFGFIILMLFFFFLRSGRRRSGIAPFVIGSMLGSSRHGGGGGFSGGGGSFGGGGASGRW